jgi:hypothetical protein
LKTITRDTDRSAELAKGAHPRDELPSRWLWLAGMILLAVPGYRALPWLPGSFVVPAGLWTAWVRRRAARRVL